jgi:NitT/TauT family transport system substrate-binding protein
MRPRSLPFGRDGFTAWLLLLAGAVRAGTPLPEPLPAGSSAPAVPVSLVLLWQHQAQFAGYYMALEQGFYRREGLDLQIRRGGPDVSPCDELASGRADFCVAMLPTAIEKRGSGVPLVLLAQVVNRSNFALVAWKHPPSAPATTIASPADLANRRISLWGADLRLPYLAFFRTQGIQPELVPQYYAPSLFLHQGVDACAVMRYNEYHRLMQNGVRPDAITVFNLWEHGVVLPEDGLYTTEQAWRDQPGRCRAFARASLDGWRFARANPEQTLDVVMRYIEKDNLPTNRPHMRWMLSEILRSIFPDTGDTWRFGLLTPEAYAKAAELLQYGSALPAVPAFDALVTPEARGNAR